MKPAPFEKQISNPANKTAFLIETDPDKSETRVLHRSSKKLVWKMPVHIGRKAAYVSPDGKTLVAYGEYWYGGMIKADGDPDIFIVYVNGKQTAKKSFKDIFGRTIEDVCNERKLKVMGGPWVDISNFIKKFEINFDTNSAVLTLHDKTKKIVPFK